MNPTLRQKQIPPDKQPLILTPVDVADIEAKQRLFDSDTTGVDANSNLERVAQLMRGMPEDQGSANELQSLRMGWQRLLKMRSHPVVNILHLDTVPAANAKKYTQQKARDDLRAQWINYYTQESKWFADV